MTDTQLSRRQRFTPPRPIKDIVIAYAMAIFWGLFGMHRFYVYRKWTALTQLGLTVLGLLTVGVGVGVLPLLAVLVWVIVDLFLLPGMVRRANLA